METLRIHSLRRIIYDSAATCRNLELAGTWDSLNHVMVVLVAAVVVIIIVIAGWHHQWWVVNDLVRVLTRCSVAGGVAGWQRHLWSGFTDRLGSRSPSAMHEGVF